MRRLLRALLPVADVLLLPFVYPAAWLLKNVRRVGVHRLRRCKDALLKVGVFPIRNHYYEPQFDNRDPSPAFAAERNLPGIDWNVPGQLGLLERFRYAGELLDLPQHRTGPLAFHFNNRFFESGDAEYWYQLIRTVRPRRIIEIGSGYSTLMATSALRRNRSDDPGYRCEHICIEPYEVPWLEQAGVTVVRRRAEETELSFFSQLADGDILFIDSSHVIRPQGDVLFEYLEVLPSLNPGVIVHVHDIFSPRNYPGEWLTDEVRLWNEQYLLEAFLSDNRSWKVLGALNYLHHNHYEKLKAAAPYLTPEREPGSFYIRKIR
ncbi:MAG: class I SAM-dependent methyltransferase [Nevskiaceae bacterium]